VGQRQGVEGRPSGNRSHGHSWPPSRTYRAWQMLRQRCTNPKTNGYDRYGAVGVAYDPRWDSFTAFLADVGEAPSREHSIDRVDSARGYWPNNVRWATRREQQCNLKSNVRVTYKGETHVVAEWARRIGVTRQAMHRRLRLWKDDPDRIFTPLVTALEEAA
jgi:hypothetical protein